MSVKRESTVDDVIGSQTEYNFSKARFEKTGIWISKARSENWPVENACFGLKKRLELNSLRSRRLEVVGKRENGRVRGVRSPLACVLLARPFFLLPTTSKLQATSWKTRQHATAKISQITPHKLIWEI